MIGKVFVYDALFSL